MIRLKGGLNTLRFNIKLANDKTIELILDDVTTIKELKEKIIEKYDGMSHFTLTWAGVTLDDDTKMLKSYAIKNGDIIVQSKGSLLSV